MDKQKYKISKIPISKIKPSPYNPRTISEKAKAGLQKSLEKFGNVQPIVWNRKTSHIVGGHQRFEIIKQNNNVKEIDVVEVNLSDKEEKALNITLNNPNITGDFTDDLDDILNELKIDMPDFEEFNFDDLMKPEIKKGLIDEDEIPEVKKSICKNGDLWQLGEHRLLCGDNIKNENIEKFMKR